MTAPDPTATPRPPEYGDTVSLVGGWRVIGVNTPNQWVNLRHDAAKQVINVPWSLLTDPTATPRQGGTGLTEGEREALANLCDVEAVEGRGKPGYCYRHHAPAEWIGHANASEVCCVVVETAVAPLLADRAAALTARLSEPDVVEAAARALAQQADPLSEWHRLDALIRDAFRDDARAALAATAGVVGGRS